MVIVNVKELIMSKLLITTQVYENYAWREDGTIGKGDDAYWKAKGGNDYVVKNIPWKTEDDFQNALKILAEVTPKIECDNDYFRETAIGWEVVADDYLTEYERNQLEYDGEIAYPAREILVGD